MTGTSAVMTAKYLGPTATLGSRIKFTSYYGSVTVPYTHNMRRNVGFDEAIAIKAFYDTYLKRFHVLDIKVTNVEIIDNAPMSPDTTMVVFHYNVN